MLTNRIKSVGIVGTGYYIPPEVVTNKSLEDLIDTSDEWIKTRTGIAERRKAAPDIHTSHLGAKAAQMALADAGVSSEDVDLIIVATSTPDMIFPATACIIQEMIGANRAAAFDLEAACTGFIYALAVGQQFVATGMYKTVLIVGSEIYSRLVDWEDRGTCILFGDGAGAAVLQEVPEGYGILANYLGSDGSGADLLKIPAGGAVKPATTETVANREHFIKMAGNDVFKFAVKIMEEATVKGLDKAGLNKSHIDMLIPHQANIRIIEGAMKKLSLPKEKVSINIDKYGNMSAASIPVALHEAREQGRIGTGDVVVLVGFGAGLTWGSTVLRWYNHGNTDK